MMGDVGERAANGSPGRSEDRAAVDGVDAVDAAGAAGPAGSDGSAQPVAAAGQARGAGDGEVRLPGPRWRRGVLLAPGLAVLGFLLLIGTAVEDDQHGKHAAALCHRLAVPWTLVAMAWASLLCGAASVVVCVLFFRVARRAGQRGAECWQGTLAVCICVAGVLALIFQVVAVYGVHAESGEAYWKCAGVRELTAVLGGW
ncbi:MAG: hypothetical protein FWE15_24965 [Actinomycetia bacterium]|nr:hypothetical protein [Actinomycetes bacterium]